MKHTAAPARRIALAAVTGLLALGLTACGSDEKTDKSTDDQATSDKGDDQRSRHALEQVVEANEATLDSQMDALKTMYSDVAVRAEGDNTLVFNYVFANEMPAEGTKALQGEQNPMAEQVRTTVIPQLEKAGVKEPQVRVIISNPDGTELYDETVTAEE